MGKFKLDDKEYDIGKLEKKYDSFKVATYEISIGGKDITKKAQLVISKLTVENSIDAASLCKFNILNAYDYEAEKFKYIDDYFVVNKEIEVKAGYLDKVEIIFAGIITNVDFNLAGGSSPKIDVVCMDKSTLMMKAKKSKIWNKKKHSEIVKEIAGNYSLKVDPSDTKTVHEEVKQGNQSDYDFVKYLAKLNGCEFFAVGDNLYFRTLHETVKSSLALSVGKRLNKFSCKEDLGTQVGGIKVKGYNAEKKLIEGMKNEVKDSGSGDADGIKALKAKGKSTVHEISLPVNSKEEAEKIAESLLKNVSLGYITGTGNCVGIPELMAGRYLKVDGIWAKTKEAKTLYMTKVNHTLSSNGFKTEFHVGRKTQSLAGDKGPLSGIDDESRKIYGVVVGEVVDIKDDKNWGRIKAKLPDRFEDIQLDWARMAVPMAGKGMGTYFLPEPGDQVLIAFRNGDIKEPFIIGSLWNEKEAPPEKNEDGKNFIKKIKSKKAHEIIFNDSDDKGAIEIKTSNGSTVRIEDTDGGIITVMDKSGKNKVVVDGDKSVVQLKGDSKIEFISGESKIILDSAKNSIDINSTAKVSIAAAQISLKADGTLDLKSDGMVSISGNPVKIN